jgi:hypothetical protein
MPISYFYLQATLRFDYYIIPQIEEMFLQNFYLPNGWIYISR